MMTTQKSLIHSHLFLLLVASAAAFISFAVYYPTFIVWEQTFHTGPQMQGLLIAIIALSEVILNTVYGKLSTHFRAASLMVAGLLFISLASFVMVVSISFAGLIFSSSMLGIGLALTTPSLSLMVLNLVNQEYTSRAMSILSIGRDAGSFFGIVCGILLSKVTFWSIPGWRIAFLMAFLIQISLSIWILRKIASMPKEEKKPVLWNGFYDLLSLGPILKIFKIKSVILIYITETCVYMVVGVLSFLILFVQLVGFSNIQLMIIIIAFFASNIIGYILGGMIGDLAAKQQPYFGRIFSIQLSCVLSAIFYTIFFVKIPKTPEAFNAMLMMTILIGLSGRWMLNMTLLSEVIEKSLRAQSYAFLRMIQLIGLSLAPPITGWIAERYFGYVIDQSREQMAYNANAIASSMKIMILSLITVNFLLTLVLYKYFPKDKAALEAKSKTIT